MCDLIKRLRQAVCMHHWDNVCYEINNNANPPRLKCLWCDKIYILGGDWGGERDG